MTSDNWALVIAILAILMSAASLAVSIAAQRRDQR